MENGGFMGFNGGSPSDERLQKNYGKSPYLAGKTHDFDWAMFNSKLSVITRVSNTMKNPMKPPYSYGLPMVFLWFTGGYFTENPQKKWMMVEVCPQWTGSCRVAHSL